MDERKPHDAHSVGFFDFWAQAYIFRMLGFLLLLFTILLFLFTTLTQGKKGFMAGRGGDSVSLLFELWFGNNRRRASERSLYCRLYHMSGRFWDTGSCFCGFAISYLLSLSFSFLHRFSLTTGPLDHAGVGFGLRKNTSSSTSVFDLVLVVMCWCCWYMMNPTSCTAAQLLPWDLALQQAFDSASLALGSTGLKLGCLQAFGRHSRQEQRSPSAQVVRPTRV
ncbi:hypothetical protein M438DRAFT_5743 [Aureobasidium pullulans EXF-150]|uniref:Uncharacterized protein n=1 Tax=Aureobasidium pullulans EXF-150 TaxID=1043002 RepID=A0A074Y5B4_AURPU|nr:uncharacterized protein M438DRAFT_5743 [Aureobasidium pullulans EXF-150]KEQ89387.1 hypothetical protein M438DRAFT_5743 [Aureobasidium pullulans EXF-150]